jgi:hypothetical protein
MPETSSRRLEPRSLETESYVLFIGLPNLHAEVWKKWAMTLVASDRW